MLQTIRDYTQGWIASVIISIIILTFALWGIHSYFLGSGVSDTVAVVNDVAITKDQLSQAYERLKKQIQAKYGSNALSQNQEFIKNRALQALIETEVLKQASLAQGFFVSDAQIDLFLQNIPDFQVNGQFSVQRFQELLTQSMITPEQFLDSVRTSLLVDQPKLGIVFSAFALPSETDAALALVNQQRAITYLTLTPTPELLKQTVVTPEQIQAYYKQHKKEFMTPEQVSVDYIELSTQEIAASIPVSDDKLKNYYNENLNSYTQPLQLKVASIELPLSSANESEASALLAKGKQIASALAKNQNPTAVTTQYQAKYSDSDWMTINQFPADLQKAVGEINKPGQVLGPIKTDKAIVVSKVMAVNLPKVFPFEEVKAKVKATYTKQLAEEKFADMKERLADLTYEHPDNLQNAATALKLPIKTSEVFSRDKEGTGLAKNKKIRDIAFSDDVLNLRNNSDVISVSPEDVFVIRINTHTLQSALPLKEVTPQIVAKLNQEESMNQLANLSEALVKSLNAGTSAAQVALTNKVTWTNVGNITRYAKSVDSAILDLAFRMPKPTVKQKVVYQRVRLTNGYAIVGLSSVTPGSMANDKEREVFAEQIQRANGMMDYELYKQSQVARAKIKTS